MSYPFDQFAAVAGANRQLALKCAEIMREAGQRQAAIASRTFELLSAQSAEKADQITMAMVMMLTRLRRSAMRAIGMPRVV